MLISHQVFCYEFLKIVLRKLCAPTYKRSPMRLNCYSFVLVAYEASSKMFKFIALFALLFAVAIAEPEAKPQVYSGVLPYSYGSYNYGSYPHKYGASAYSYGSYPYNYGAYPYTHGSYSARPYSYGYTGYPYSAHSNFGQWGYHY
ncbi:hypothetical protein FQA39_LY01860 [Lamprigera yunnana]|nr:hypothetical protein FQA39_LY01860 [Lamprigera yunnana]